MFGITDHGTVANWIHRTACRYLLHSMTPIEEIGFRANLRIGAVSKWDIRHAEEFLSVAYLNDELKGKALEAFERHYLNGTYQDQVTLEVYASTKCGSSQEGRLFLESKGMKLNVADPTFKEALGQVIFMRKRNAALYNARP
jgi:hypothetical protein